MRKAGTAFTALLTFLMLAGCSGQLVCQWQTEDEQMQKLIQETINGLQKQNETRQKPQTVQQVR